MKALALVAILALGSIAHAEQTFEQLGFSSETEMQNYLNVTDIKVQAVEADASEYAAPAAPVNPALALGTGLLDSLGPVLLNPSNTNAWIAFGKKAWEVVVANQPVANVQTTRVAVLPVDKAAWAQMSGWRGPRGMVYTIQAVNGFGSTVVDQKYTVSYNYGGQLNGKGRYLANVTIIPTSISVAWAYTLNSSVEVGQILNTGTVESPVPSVDLQLKWGAKTILSSKQGVESFYVKGDGGIQQISQ